MKFYRQKSWRILVLGKFLSTVSRPVDDLQILALLTNQLTALCDGEWPTRHGFQRHLIVENLRALAQGGAGRVVGSSAKS